MRYSVQDILGFTIVASDAACGHLHDILFDDTNWGIRYLVLRHKHATGRRLFQLPIEKLYGIDTVKRTVHYCGTSASAQSESLVDIDPPVSRQQQLKRSVIWALAPIYGFDFTWGTVPIRPNWPDRIRNKKINRKLESLEVERHYDPHLRSSREVIGYRVQAPNGKIGRVSDILIDVKSHVVLHVVVEWRRFWRSTRALLPVHRIHGICWPLMRVSTQMDKKAVQSLPRHTTE